MRNCIVCQKSAPAITFVKTGTSINDICDSCLANGRVGKFIRSLIDDNQELRQIEKSSCDELERKIVIKDLTIKRLQQDMRHAKIREDTLLAENEKLNLKDLELSFREQSFKENDSKSDSQISLLNEVLNTETS